MGVIPWRFKSSLAHMRSFFRFLRARRFSYKPLVQVEISRDALKHNLEYFLKLSEVKSQNGSSNYLRGIAPVLKANAYGHGLVEVARIVDGLHGVRFLVVDSYYEALRLRNENIISPILVIGYTITENILENSMSNVAFCVSSISQLRALSNTIIPTTFHLKFDIGMHRQGIMPNELYEVIDIVHKHPQMQVTGICSHLSDSDGEEDIHTKRQIAIWNDISKKWRNTFPNTEFFHLSATAGIRYLQHIDANVSRLGIGLYGISDDISGLIPVLSMKTIVTAVRTVHIGETVGYNNTWTATRETIVATIPVGYYEGIDRRLSNSGFVRIGGIECQIIGRVSMNMMTVDATEVPNVKEGDIVEVISSIDQAPNSIKNIARICDTIPYDILVHIPTSLKRVVV